MLEVSSNTLKTKDKSDWKGFNLIVYIYRGRTHKKRKKQSMCTQYLNTPVFLLKWPASVTVNVPTASRLTDHLTGNCRELLL